MNGDDIMNHVTALESMAAQLNDLGVNVTDHDIMTKIVCSLPGRFDNLVSSWDGMPETEKTLLALRARLVSEERKITLRNAQAQVNKTGNDQTQNHANSAFIGNGGGKRGGRGGFKGNRYLPRETNRRLIDQRLCADIVEKLDILLLSAEQGSPTRGLGKETRREQM